MARSPKNIVYIMLDDADFYDFGLFNQLLSDPDAQTPSIDYLGANGVAFTQFYSAGPVCTPTRISVLTGDSPLQFGSTHVWPQLERIVQGSASVNGLPNDIAQMGHLMQDLGLVTGHFGKWHVGQSRPEYGHAALGFDSFAYYDKSPDDPDYKDWDGPAIFHTEEGDYVADVDYVDEQFTNEVIDFIVDQSSSDQGFYLNFWPLTPHAPIAEPRNFDNSETQFDLSTQRGKLLAMMYTIDLQIGRIVDALRSTNQLDDTLIIVTSDNGGLAPVQNETSDLRGSKATLWEGGINVPMIAYWPEGIAPGGENATVMTTTDLLPTFLQLLGADPTGLYSDISGRSKAEAFTSSTLLPHDPIVWQIEGGPSASDDPRGDTWQALRYGDYKLLKRKGRNDAEDDNAYDLSYLPTEKAEYRNLLNNDVEKEIGDRMKEILLSERIDASRIVDFPEDASTQVTVPFDPRYAVGTKGMTLNFNLRFVELGSTLELFNMEGAQKLILRPDGSVEWVVIGPDSPNNGAPVTKSLISDPLSPGEYTITLSVQGYKNGPPLLNLAIDGAIVDRIEPDDPDPIYAFWSVQSDVQFGAAGVEITEARFHTLNFWLDEVEHFYDQPFLPHSFGSPSDDVLTGTDAAESIFGARGNDYLAGGSDNDELRGNSGNDVLDGGLGADLIDGGSGVDLVSYFHSTRGVVVNLANPDLNARAAIGDVIINVENVVGSDADWDVIIGSDAANILSGAGGDDTIDGGAGSDRLFGNEGADTFRFSPMFGFDRVMDFELGDRLDVRGIGISSISGFHAAFTTEDGTTVLRAGDSKIAVLGTDISELDFLFSSYEYYGSSGDDVISGDMDSNRIIGEAGNDTLGGLAGEDWLIGDEGSDTFLFTPETEFDRIVDYEAGDVIDVSSLGVSNIGAFDRAFTTPAGHSIVWADGQKLVVLETDLDAIEFAFADDSSASSFATLAGDLAITSPFHADWMLEAHISTIA